MREPFGDQNRFNKPKAVVVQNETSTNRGLNRMLCKAKLHARFEQCAEIIFSESSLAGIERDKNTVQALAFSLVAPELFKERSFAHWIDFPSVKEIPGSFVSRWNPLSIEFLIDKGVLSRDSDDQLGLSSDVSKSSLLFTSLAASGWIDQSAKEIRHNLEQLQLGVIDVSARTRILDLRVQGAAFLGGTSYYNELDGTLATMGELYCDLSSSGSTSVVELDEIDSNLIDLVMEGAYCLQKALSLNNDAKNSQSGTGLSKEVTVNDFYAGHDNEKVKLDMEKCLGAMASIREQCLELSEKIENRPS